MKTFLRLAVIVSLAAFSALAAAQTFLTTRPPLGEKEWPVVKEGTTRKISPHVYVIPSESVPRVPNVGIIVGTKATMIIDPGMGLLSGQAVAREMAKVSKNTELFVVATHFHPEHTTGEAAFPTAKIVRAKAQHQDVEDSGMQWIDIFAKRSRELTQILDRRFVPQAGRDFRQGEDHRPGRRPRPADVGRARAYAGRHGILRRRRQRALLRRSGDEEHLPRVCDAPVEHARVACPSRRARAPWGQAGHRRARRPGATLPSSRSIASYSRQFKRAPEN